MSFVIIYLPDASIIKHVRSDVEDTFNTHEEAEEVINSNRILFDKEDEIIPYWINSQPLTDISERIFPVKAHLLDIIEI